ncbi:pentapeptide repeat-containing protein [Alcaligenes aquatilis]|uniref:pentapeptide repeat-containing protein n=1 Tax=Alcaligenes aquatilis TaxID=323284 RepID=UPI003F8F13E2
MLSKKNKSLSRLSIFHRKFKKNITNKFYSKAQCFRVDFSKISISNTNFKGAILTSCNFKGTRFANVEFLGTNIKNSNFTNAHFKNCIFSRILMKKSNFKNCIFDNCIFVNTNTNIAKNIYIADNNKIFKKQPAPEVSEEIIMLLNSFKLNLKIKNSRVLHLKGGKINAITLLHLIENIEEKRLIQGLIALNGDLPHRIVTANSLSKVIDKAAHQHGTI